MLDPSKKVFSLFDEFKKFAFKGNMIDLAIAVVLGAAFKDLIDSLVQKVMMPLIGVILPGEQGYAGWVLKIGDATIPYGEFLGQLVKFIVIAFAVFIFMVKVLGWLRRARKEEGPPPLTKDQELLMEIRDLLKKPLAG